MITHNNLNIIEILKYDERIEIHSKTLQVDRFIG